MILIEFQPPPCLNTSFFRSTLVWISVNITLWFNTVNFKDHHWKRFSDVSIHLSTTLSDLARLRTGYSRKLVRLLTGIRGVFLSAVSRLILVPIKFLSAGVKRTGREAYCSPPSCAEINIACCYTSLPMHLHVEVLNCVMWQGHVFI